MKDFSIRNYINSYYYNSYIIDNLFGVFKK